MNRRILRNNLLVLALGTVAVMMTSQKSNAQIPQCLVYPTQQCGQCLTPYYLQYNACVGAGIDPAVCEGYVEPGVSGCFTSGACVCQ